jgi:glucose-1-phosphate thymidylyltransferase
MWGIIPAAGSGTRIQPLAFSKELLPVGSRFDGSVERPRAVSEYLAERMILAGATRICFVISQGKSDILEYFGGSFQGVPVCYAVQPRPVGLCDAVFQAAPLVHPDERIVIGLPDTVWFPEDALTHLPADVLAFLLFPVERPELFDAVITGERERVLEVRVKQPEPGSSWIWGAIGAPGRVFHELRSLWHRRGSGDEYLGTLVNAYLAGGGPAVGIRAGRTYVDVGTLHGYREAIRALGAQAHAAAGGTDDAEREEGPGSEGNRRRLTGGRRAEDGPPPFGTAPARRSASSPSRIE